MKYSYDYPRPCVTVDAVVFKEGENDLEILLILRKNPPYDGKWALPGGFMDMDETLEAAAVRELEEETGLSGVDLKQFYSFDAVDRDPRARTIGVAHYGFTSADNASVKGMDDAEEAGWFSINDLPGLAFDHELIIKKVLELIKQA